MHHVTRTASRYSPALVAARVAAIVALTACASVQTRYEALPEGDRAAYEDCAQRRCGSAPQWKGEANWAVRQYERERAAHAACWDSLLSDYVELPDGLTRKTWLASRCTRQGPLGPEFPMGR
jgi:hypothetical protein